MTAAEFKIYEADQAEQAIKASRSRSKSRSTPSYIRSAWINFRRSGFITFVNKDKVIELAMEEVGYTEGENNFNKYAPIAGLANNLPWCNSFIAAIFIQAGLKQAIPITAAVASTEAWGLKNDRLVKLEEAKRGDLILMDFTNSGRAQHIGLAINRYNPIKKTIHTVEGNTGEKSQANGEGVAYKTRSAKFIKCVVRPKYPKKQLSGAEIEGKKK
jgi:uncharacterized ubiquitin-like protein YukD